jgi:adenine-specific DNA-methyltransferase
MSVSRLKDVAKGEQSGISKLVGWTGGGDFVYCELAKSNAQFADAIKAAKDSKTLKDIWKQMNETGYLNYRIVPSTIDENATDFEALTIEDQKHFLIECLDKNLLYIPLSDMDSEEYSISDDDKRLTKEFYKKN